MGNRAKDILLIIPAYNEEANIQKVLDEIIDLGLNLDFMVVDDGSCDATSELVAKYGCVVLRHPFNMGYGVALHTGFKYAVREGYELVVTIDADGQHPVKSITDLMDCQKETEADVVIGSRFMSNMTYPFSLPKNVVRWFFMLLSYLILKRRITDPTSGFQLLTKPAFSFLANIDYPEDYPDLDIIILLGLKGFKIEETAVKMAPRTDGSSIHSGLRPLYYSYKIILAVLVVFIDNMLTITKARK